MQMVQLTRRPQAWTMRSHAMAMKKRHRLLVSTAANLMKNLAWALTRDGTTIDAMTLFQG